MAVHGAIGNRRFLDKADDERYEAILDRPGVVLPKLDGPFALAAYDRRDEEFLVATDTVGTRLPWPHGAFQDHVAKLPDEAFRIRTLPFSLGKLPYAASPLKLELVRRLDRGLDWVPYERTGINPARSLPVHAAGYSFVKARELLADEPSPYARWYRDDRQMRRFVDGLLADAGDRPFFDADAVADLREAVLSGESGSMRAISAITTIECWLQNNYEGTSRAVAPRATQPTR